MKKIIASVIALATASMIFAGSVFAIDMNSADAMALDNSDLMRVGPAIAKRIVDERTMNGPFKDASDLASRVSGVGPRFLEQNADKMQFGGVTAPATTPATTPATPTTPAQ